jgi:hypothetical protein
MWKQVAELEGSVNGVYFFGGPVAISGTTAVVGPCVFTKTANGWKQVAELNGSDTVADEDAFGDSVAISGTTIVVGAPDYANNAGRAYVFMNKAGVWKQAAELKGSDTVAGDYFGYSVAISGTTVVATAYGYDSAHTGAAYVFTKTATGWKQAAELKGSDTAAGDDFGGSVAISGTTAVVGPCVFTKTANGWKQVAELNGSDTVADEDAFGDSVAISGTTAVVGAYGGDGVAYVFTKTATGWKQAAELVGPMAFDDFGGSVAISGTTVVVGADEQGSEEFVGRAYVFTKMATGWGQVAELKGSGTMTEHNFGSEVAISGTTAVVAEASRAYVFEG